MVNKIDYTMIIFVFSTGRTGTVYLDQLLTQLPYVTSVHERYYRYFRIVQNINLLHGKLPFIDNLMLKIYEEKLRAASEKDYHFEINPPLKGKLNYLVKTFPSAFFIHIVRDPRDYVTSYINWTNEKLLNKLLKLYFPYWEISTQRFRLIFSKEKLFELAVTNWCINNKVLNTIKDYTDNYLFIKFEDLKKDPIHTLKYILNSISYFYVNNVEQYLDLNKILSYQNKSTGSFSSWQYWNDYQIHYLHTACADLMHTFSYGNENA